MYYLACFGDSLIEGYPFGRDASWCAAAEAATANDGLRALKLLNYGLCGDCTDDIIDRMRFQRRALPSYVEHIVFLGGANDIIQGMLLRQTMQNLERMTDWCSTENLQLCLVLPLLSGEIELNSYIYALREEIELNSYIYALREEIEQRLSKQAYLLDLQPAIGIETNALRRAYFDGVHPSCATYRALGEYAAPLLQHWLEKTKNQQKIFPS